jgi:hypothetical protein
MQAKYLTGRQHKNGAAYNPINLQYEQSPDGEDLKRRDDDAKVRALMRSKNLDVRSNCGFNPINGVDRSGINVPHHNLYYPPESAMKSVGETIIGSGYAGRPLRKELFMTPQKQANPKLEYYLP